MLGTKQPAEDGKLVVLASGQEDLRGRAQPVFDAVGQKTIWVGDAGAGTRLKLVVNSWVLTVTEGTAETIALAEGMGLDPSLLFDAIDGGALDLPYLRVKGNAMIERDFDPAFRLELAAKDARLVDDSAKRVNLDLPVAGRDRAADDRGGRAARRQGHGRDVSDRHRPRLSDAAGRARRRVSAAALIVGSGHNGLAAAITLARAGWRVTVLEAATAPGGAVATEELTLPGFAHDVYSAVHPAAAASPVFERMPLEHHGLRWVHPEACYAHPLADGRGARCTGI